jgi:hypothetical protein
MRDYGKVHSAFWSSEDTRSLHDDGRMLALYLLTCQHNTIAGVFRIPDGYACDDLQWSSERVQEGFEELFQKGFANRCETSKWVWIYKFLKWNAPENPNQQKAVAKIAAQVPDSCGWKPEFMRVCGKLGASPDGNGLGRVSKGSRNQKQKQKQKQDKSAGALDGFAEFWSAYPKKQGKAAAEKAWGKLAPDADLQTRILTAVDVAKRSDGWRKDGGQFIPQPATWLNGRRWEDEPTTVVEGRDSSENSLFSGAI